MKASTIKTLFKLAVMVLSLGASLNLASTAMAQDSKLSAEREKAANLARMVKDTQKLVDQYGLPCEVIEAADLGEVTAQQDGKTIKLNSYEIACKNLQGFLISQYKDAPFGDPISCNQAQALNSLNPQAPVCRLKANRTSHYWLGDTAKSKIPNCQIAGARWIYRDAATGRETYEISCKGVAGGIFVVPSFKSEDKSVTFVNCLKANDTPLKCQNTAPELMIKVLAPLVQKASAKCEMTNARFVGGTKEAEYYEVGCKDMPGFVLVTDLAGQFQGAVGCDKADKIGGCKFTSAETLNAANASKRQAAIAQYSEALTKAAIACTAEDVNRIGKHEETGRDVVEFKCPEAPLGLVAFIPPTSSQATFETIDCFAAKTASLNCRFVSDTALLSHLQSLAVNHKSIKPDCVLSQARYAFMGGGGSIVMELACVNKRGYIAVLNKARTSINPAVPCHIAATSDKVPEKCSIAGNGSNKAE